MGIQLGAQGTELSLRSELGDVLLTQLSFITFVRHSNRVDSPPKQHADKFECRNVVGQESPSACEIRDDERISRRFCDLNEHDGGRP